MIAAAALLLAAAATPAPVGDWAWVPAHRDTSLAVQPCATDHGVSYRANGTWRSFLGDEEGRWRIEGDVLVEQVTRRHDDVRGTRAVRAAPTRVRLRWLDRDHLNVVDRREVAGLIRCPT